MNRPTTAYKSNIGQIVRSLLVADFTTQYRRGRAVFASYLVPIILLFAWRKAADKLGGAFVVTSSLSIGLISIGLFGYSVSLAQDRAKGIFQRLRVTPAPTWAIMISRLAVQLASIVTMTIVVLVGALLIDNVQVGVLPAIATVFSAVIGGVVFLSLGQAIVALVASVDAVNSVARFAYIALVVVGIIGSFGVLGDTGKTIVEWSPYGTLQIMLQAALQASAWSRQIWEALFANLGYAIVFAAIGISYFRWNVE